MTGRQDALLDHLGQFDRGEALFLGGSLGRGAGDEHSDIDLICVATRETAGEIVAEFRAHLETLAKVVYWRETPFYPRLVNAVLADWSRVDLLVLDADALKLRAAGTLKPVSDPQGLHADLPDSVAPASLDPARVTRLVEDFLRVLGLLPVACGRREWASAVSGWSLQRETLIALLRLAAGERDTGSMLHLSAILPVDDMALVDALPSPDAERGEVLDAHAAVTRAFLPRAKSLASRVDATWPSAFEAATLERVSDTLGVDYARRLQ